MGFYIRKSISVGGFRFNLSKSGVGVSAGVKGFRVGVGPRGHYVHVGAGGLYYRATLPAIPARRARASAGGTRADEIPQYEYEPVPQGAVVHFESAETGKIIDSSAVKLLAEINTNRSKLSLAPVVGFLLGLAAYLVLIAHLGPIAGWVAVIGALALTGAARWWDIKSKTTVLFYELEPDAERRYEALHAAFARLQSVSAVWRVKSEQSVSDRKRNAGAYKNVVRTKISPVVGNPRWVKSNIDAPSIEAGDRTFYFYPDRVLIFDKDSAGAVSYRDLELEIETERFIEEGSVPSDAERVDWTWRFVNKKGGPDKRFKNNRQLPIMRYEALDFSSGSGLRLRLQVSKVGTGQPIREAIDALASALPAVT